VKFAQSSEWLTSKYMGLCREHIQSDRVKMAADLAGTSR
jgi:hypothetical protein